MQLFTPAQVRSAAEQRGNIDAQRAKNIASLTDELLKTRQEAEKDFEEGMKAKQKLAEKWYEDNLVVKKELLAEVERLEKRRQEALSPLKIKAEDIHTTQEALLARQLEIEERERACEEDSRRLMLQLDNVSTRSQDLEVREKRLKVMETGAETQKNQIAQDAKRFNLQLVDFYKRSEEKESDFAYRESELDAKKNLYDEKERLLVERENEIEAAKRLLADQRMLLEKGFEELRRLKIKQ